MRLLQVVCLLFCLNSFAINAIEGFTSAISTIDDVESEVIVEAVNGMLLGYFGKTPSIVDIVYSGTKSQMISEKILRTKSERQFVTVNDITKVYIDFASPTILLLETKDHFHHYMKYMTWITWDGLWHKHLVYAPGLTANDILRHHKTNTSISEVDFLINYNGSAIELASAFMYTQDKCGENQMKSINRFLLKQMEWEGGEFYPEKYRNFHGCELDVFYKDTFSRVGEAIFKDLATQFKFRIKETFVNESTFDDKKNVRLGCYVSQVHDIEEYEVHVSNPLFIMQMVIVVPAGLPMTDLEKMFVMFDYGTWIAIGFTFAVSLITIKVITFMPRKVQNFVFGHGIRTPFLNVFDIFLNGGQIKIPGRNFARYLLMMFIIWSLIIRNCYQSMMFENLQTDMRHSAVRSLADFIKMKSK